MLIDKKMRADAAYDLPEPTNLATWFHGRSARPRTAFANLLRWMCVGLLAAGITPQQAPAKEDAARTVYRPKRANFELETASREARHVADWVVDSNDSRGLPFAIVDKAQAKVFMFDANGQLRGAAPALLGLARGDNAVPGIGHRPLSSIRPEERTTPAGRFVAALDRNIQGKEILWVDYETAISMHPVVTAIPAERRAQRLATPTPLDNRISYGCINVPAQFFERVVRPAFTGTDGVVYVLPETKSAREIFSSYDVEGHVRPQTAIPPAPAHIVPAAVPR